MNTTHGQPSATLFGGALRFFRALQNMSQRQLSDATGMSWGVISRYETLDAAQSRSPALGTVVNLADALALSGPERVWFFSTANMIESPLTLSEAYLLARMVRLSETEPALEYQYEEAA